ncbi:amidohydrolase [Peribacillus castrilensis]|uniref:Amidohydrolase family protein n=1 Tax=Peribacillus simplex TaxID=1478 RepID=A0AAN2PLI8_9BACI|nr:MULTISPECIES: amidohydrolase [Bacillaceae]MCP1096784.1 amidohydrolase [Bacillaceae bacterium OS4b]MCF7624672.1 amidohydrolase [Peribacillus frigoritolerans]MCP1155216.1 amidohydrolase [Peribacillus frigoritolerans]MCT1389970.1 amidohydrolase [Peribacillus frigoritolerans]MEA3574881.1 amidohydrolase [Peribacillus frigoritolerans]
MTIKKADIVLSSDAIFTGLTHEPMSGAIAILGNKILSVGSKAEIEHFIGSGTKVFNYGNQLIMPGFHDFHLHIMFSALSLTSINLFEARSAQEVAAKVLEFSKECPGEEWIIGMQWDAGYWHDKQEPHYKILDAVIPDRPVVLFHAEGHYTWVNSKAMELAGVTEEIRDPDFGRYERDKNGLLTGILYEEAQQIVLKEALRLTQNKKETILKEFLRLLSQYGITSVNDLFAPIDDFLQDYDLFEKLDKQGELSTRFHITPELDGNLDKAQILRNKYESKKLQFSGLKQFVDGTVTGHTAYFLKPYSDQLDICGHPALDPEVLIDRVVKADELGFRIRFHAIGDAAIRLALDAFEEAVRKNGKRDSRHTIEHIEVIDSDDIERFSKLGVIASMQPDHMAASSREVYSSIIGPEREKNVFLTKSLLNTGASLALGTDFPVSISLNPMRQIYTAITRVDSSGDSQNTWHPEQKLTLAEALQAYTYGSAYGCFREHELGTIEEGKLADLVVLDRNLFDIPESEVLKTKVELTINDGKVVYKSEETSLSSIF